MGDRLVTCLGPGADAHELTWSPEGGRIAACCDSLSVVVWDATLGAALLRYQSHTQLVRSVAWSPDGTRIASGSDDTTVRVWTPD